MDEQAQVLWGKSNAGGMPMPLLQHLFDSAAVAEVMWDRWLAAAVTGELDAVTAGEGRRWFAWLAGMHDVGKATPAFQQQDATLRRSVEQAGLSFRRVRPQDTRVWRHELASARILLDLTDGRWSTDTQGWVWPLLAGHHGRFPDLSWVRPQRRVRGHGDGGWARVQAALLGEVAAAVGFDGVVAAEPVGRPSKAVQLAVAGLVIMADWVASNDTVFIGLGPDEQPSMWRARERATSAWNTLQLGGLWAPQRFDTVDELFATRFGHIGQAHQFQLDVAATAATVPPSSLLLVEAPTGGGKTEAALAAAETLAVRQGCNGLFVGMPTRATADPMFDRLLDWAAGEGVQVALLHGKRRFNRSWKALARSARSEGDGLGGHRRRAVRHDGGVRPGR